jgi:hypothetical protein
MHSLPKSEHGFRRNAPYEETVTKQKGVSELLIPRQMATPNS